MTHDRNYPPLLRGLISIALLSVTACATAPSENSGSGPESLEEILQIENEILDANADLETPDPEDGVTAKAETPRLRATRPRIPLEINENVLKWIRHFTTTDRDRFHRFLKRGSAYKELVKSILREHAVPTELYYLAMIESGYVTHAKSHASAVGIWQFIRGTGLRYGLRQTREIDERRDIIRSTESAAKYLRNLHTAFQSWYLAMAGYNAGEGRILGAIMRGGSRDFWELVEKKALPPETRNYVPKFLAAAIIGKHPEKYGFHDIEAPVFPKVEPAQVAGGVRLRDIATKAGIPLSTLKQVNPHLLRDMTPHNRSAYTLWVPEGEATKVQSVQAVLAQMKVRIRPQTPRTLASVRRDVHVVRRGENLSSIARRYGMNISALKRLNGLRSNQLQAGKRLSVSATTNDSRQVIHRVKRGEALAVIAERYAVSLSELRQANELRSSRIYAGQRLVIPADI